MLVTAAGGVAYRLASLAAGRPAMSSSVHHLPVAGTLPGTARTLTVRRYGHAGTRPKAYLQAGLHADEVPAMLVAHHLIRRLDAAQAAGAIHGEILVVPLANPIGLDQYVFDRPMGRFDLGGGGNFNRHFPDLSQDAAERLRRALGDDAAANVPRIRSALAEVLAARRPQTGVERLRHMLLELAIDADIVLDLHCDDEAPMHVYLGTPLWPDAEDLTRQIGARAVLLAEISGGNPFDEACSSPWWRLPAILGDDKPIPPACLAATVELRGLADVSDDLAARDAANLIAFLQRRGVVAGDPGPLPEPCGTATPLAGVDMVAAPCAGIVAFRVGIGDIVREGDIVADIIDPAADDPLAGRTPVAARTSGMVWSRLTERFAHPSDIIAKIAGPEPLPGKGAFLLTAR
jgi:predicted deacylase